MSAALLGAPFSSSTVFIVIGCRLVLFLLFGMYYLKFEQPGIFGSYSVSMHHNTPAKLKYMYDFSVIVSNGFPVFSVHT